MDQVGCAAKVGKGTLFRHFGDRCGLMRALLDERERSLQEDFIRGPAPLGPGAPARERLVACRNAELAKLRAHKREDVLVATEQSLGKIKGRVDDGKLRAGQEIGLRVGKVVNQYKVAKHFELAITDNTFTFARKSGYSGRS